MDIWSGSKNLWDAITSRPVMAANIFVHGSICTKIEALFRHYGSSRFRPEIEVIDIILQLDVPT